MNSQPVLQACPHGSVEFRLRPPGMDLWTSHTPSAAELALQFMLLGAIYVHHLPVVTSQLGLDPALLDATLPHCIASLSILTLPGLLALGAHGVTHYLTRITHHLSLHQQRMPQRVRQESGSETGASNESGNARGDSRSAPAEGDLQGEFIAAMRVRLVRVGAASLQAGSEMALETRDAAGLQLKDLSTQLLKSLRRAGSNLRLSQMAALQSATANAPRPSQSKPMKASSDDSSSSRAAGDLKLAELSSRQKLPTAAVQAAVGRSQPPQKFLQLAYGYLPLVWAGTLTHYLPAFLLQAGRILPVRLSVLILIMGNDKSSTRTSNAKTSGKGNTRRCRLKGTEGQKMKMRFQQESWRRDASEEGCQPKRKGGGGGGGSR